MIESEEKYAAALAAASDEVGLPEYYRSCVRSIVVAPQERWPRCCGGGCEPCNAVLGEVARRVLERVEVSDARSAPEPRGAPDGAGSSSPPGEG